MKIEIKKKVIVVLICIISCAFIGFGLYQNKIYPISWTKFEKAQVSEVVDGDTLRVIINHQTIKVRLIGMDTPESVHSNASKNCEEGRIASKYVKELMKDKTVYLEYDEDKYDKYNRTLAYVYYCDKGESCLYNTAHFLNLELIEEGYARITTYYPNVKHLNEYEKAWQDAKYHERGFFSSGYYK